MFKDILSFNGRIRRTEYGITFIAMNVLTVVLNYVTYGGIEGIIWVPYFYSNYNACVDTTGTNNKTLP